MAHSTTKAQTSKGGARTESFNGSDVLTLTEAAAYLRVGKAEIVRMVNEEGLPGRKLGEDWRFLKAALQAWLSFPLATSGKQTLLAMAGKFKDDPYLNDIVEEAYRLRGRPITEDSE